MGDARRSFNKVIQRCPHCGSRKPKELVEGPKRLNVVAYLLFGFLTCGLGLLAFPVFNKRSLEAYCEECEGTFHPDV